MESWSKPSSRPPAKVWPRLVQSTIRFTCTQTIYLTRNLSSGSAKKAIRNLKAIQSKVLWKSLVASDSNDNFHRHRGKTETLLSETKQVVTWIRARQNREAICEARLWTVRSCSLHLRFFNQRSSFTSWVRLSQGKAQFIYEGLIRWSTNSREGHL